MLHLRCLNVTPLWLHPLCDKGCSDSLGRLLSTFIMQTKQNSKTANNPLSAKAIEAMKKPGEVKSDMGV